MADFVGKRSSQIPYQISHIHTFRASNKGEEREKLRRGERVRNKYKMRETDEGRERSTTLQYPNFSMPGNLNRETTNRRSETRQVGSGYFLSNFAEEHTPSEEIPAAGMTADKTAAGTTGMLEMGTGTAALRPCRSGLWRRTF